LRASAFRPEYGLMGAGAVNGSLIGRLPGKALALGPVAAVSFRVASRIVNALGAGIAARSPDELNGVRQILFHSPPQQFSALIETLSAAGIKWKGKSLVFCDCDCSAAIRGRFTDQGAYAAVLRRSALPGRLVMEGCGAALGFAHRLARDLGQKAIELSAEKARLFEMAITMGSGALSPLIDQSAMLLRQCGLRDTEAAKLAAAVFERTARDFSRTGRQSWVWYQRPPDDAELAAELNAVPDRVRRLVGELILLGLEETGRHSEAAAAIRDLLGATRSEEHPPDPAALL